jgi:hypothetical protein
MFGFHAAGRTAFALLVPVAACRIERLTTRRRPRRRTSENPDHDDWLGDRPQLCCPAAGHRPGHTEGNEQAQCRRRQSDEPEPTRRSSRPQSCDAETCDHDGQEHLCALKKTRIRFLSSRKISGRSGRPAAFMKIRVSVPLAMVNLDIRPAAPSSPISRHCSQASQRLPSICRRRSRGKAHRSRPDCEGRWRSPCWRHCPQCRS